MIAGRSRHAERHDRPGERGRAGRNMSGMSAALSPRATLAGAVTEFPRVKRGTGHHRKGNQPRAGRNQRMGDGFDIEVRARHTDLWKPEEIKITSRSLRKLATTMPQVDG